MKNRLDIIYNAFTDYIRKQDYFDIVYSEKIGYLRILVREPDFVPDILDTPEKMLSALFNDIIQDVVFSPGNPNKNHERLTLTQYEKAESRQRITAILETMEDGYKVSCLNFMNAYFKKHQEDGAWPGWHNDE